MGKAFGDGTGPLDPGERSLERLPRRQQHDGRGPEGQVDQDRRHQHVAADEHDNGGDQAQMRLHRQARLPAGLRDNARDEVAHQLVRVERNVEPHGLTVCEQPCVTRVEVDGMRDHDARPRRGVLPRDARHPDRAGRQHDPARDAATDTLIKLVRGTPAGRVALASAEADEGDAHAALEGLGLAPLDQDRALVGPFDDLPLAAGVSV